MPVSDFKFCERLERGPSTRKRQFARLTACTVLSAAFLTFGAISNGSFCVSAEAQSEFEKNVQKDTKKLQEDVKQKLKPLIDKLRGTDLPEGFAKTNGRIEATEIDISPKYSGRLESVLVNEGDEVKAGQVIARITSPEYEAQLRTAQANVFVTQSSLAASEAKVAQAQADLTYARGDLERGADLVQKGWLTKQLYDQRVNRFDADKAAVEAAEKQRDASKSLVAAAQAEVDRVNSILTDLTLLAPRDGRVQYRIHRSGEVVNAGERVVQILDLNDVYMTIYLPSGQAQRLTIGDEARLILDAFPDLVIPAFVSFVATEAQFTPKPVETAAERETLIFRIKLQVDPEVLKKYHTEVKTGIRGMGFVRTNPGASWPEHLAVKLP